MKKALLVTLLINLFVISYAQSADETAIKQLLEKESATWRSGDIKAHADCWQIQPYSKILISTADGTFIDVPPDAIVHPKEDRVGKGGTSVNSNYNMSIHGDNAWVSHNEVSTSKDGKINYSYEVRILERINGQWKLVAQSIHAYKPKE